MTPIQVILEIGQKRVFASALDWPGWNRSGRDENEALAALLEYGPRYGKAIASSGLAFTAPEEIEAFVVVERPDGNATTDFGAPGVEAEADARPFDAADLERSLAILDAIWETFERAAESAEGVALRKGPRGGGRNLAKIVEHVRGADARYLHSLGWRQPQASDDPAEAYIATRQAVREALAAGMRGELPERGPRGGKIWTPRYFVRRSAWHVLDHAWEIVDRAIWNAG